MPADNELSAILRYESPREGKEKIFLKICIFLRLELNERENSSWTEG